MNNINNNFTVRQTAKCCYTIVICPEERWLGGKGTVCHRYYKHIHVIMIRSNDPLVANVCEEKPTDCFATTCSFA